MHELSEEELLQEFSYQDTKGAQRTRLSVWLCCCVRARAKTEVCVRLFVAASAPPYKKLF